MSFNLQVYLVGFIMAFENEQCVSTKTSDVMTETKEECAIKCLGKSPMFLWGTEGCIGSDCPCVCETSASDDGSCEREPRNGINLYKFITGLQQLLIIIVEIMSFKMLQLYLMLTPLATHPKKT